jgi:16S rRNA (uracil1498-N3)-methyltransferase
VTLPLFVAGAGALDAAGPGAALVLAGDEGRHAAGVRRIRAGEVIDVADGAGRVARCTVDAAERDRLLLTVLAIGTVAPRLPRLVLVQALAKGGRDEAAVETATEFGVDSVIPWQAERSVVQWSGERGERSRRRWEAVALAAAKQSRRARVPVIEPMLSTAGLVARAAADRDCDPRASAAEQVLVLHEDAETPLAGLEPPASAQALLLVVGPEGGISDRELADLVAAGAQPVRLGPEVLRASSAGPAALAVLSVRLHRW